MGRKTRTKKGARTRPTERSVVIVSVIIALECSGTCGALRPSLMMTFVATQSREKNAFGAWTTNRDFLLALPDGSATEQASAPHPSMEEPGPTVFELARTSPLKVTNSAQNATSSMDHLWTQKLTVHGLTVMKQPMGKIACIGCTRVALVLRTPAKMTLKRSNSFIAMNTFNAFPRQIVTLEFFKFFRDHGLHFCRCQQMLEKRRNKLVVVLPEII